MEKLKTRGMMITAAVLILLACFGLAVLAQQASSVKGKARITGLAQLSGLDEETVTRLHKAVGDWDKLLAGIMLYKELVNIVEGEKAEKLLFRLIPHYQAVDLYTAFDYFTNNSLPLDRVTEVLDRRAAGEEWSKILADCSITPEYKNYRVVEKEELRGLLVKGHLPEDIVKADEIARAKDLSLTDVIELKTGANTWEEIGVSLGLRTGKNRQMPDFTVPGVDKAVSGQGPEALVEASNQKALERRLSEEAKIKDELGLSDGQMKVYLDQGFNLWEVRNAYKLARANGVSTEEILSRKKAGQSWEDILAAYPKK